MATVTRRGLLGAAGAVASGTILASNQVRGGAVEARQSSDEWQLLYGDAPGDYAFEDVVQTDDGGFLAVGRFRDPDDGKAHGWYVKTDAAGREQWSDTVSGHDLDDTRFNAVVAPGNGTYRVIGGISTADGTVVGELTLDADGAVQRTWESSIHGEGHGAAVASDGSTVVAGEAFAEPDEPAKAVVVKVNDGDVVWEHRVEPTDSDGRARFNDVIRGTDGGFVAAGLSTREGRGVPLLRELDPGGTETWTVRAIGDEQLEERFEFMGVTRAVDGGYVAVGEIVEPGGTAPNGHANRISAQGRASWSVNSRESELDVSGPDGFRDVIGHGDGRFTVAGYHEIHGGWVVEIEPDDIVRGRVYGESGAFSSILATEAGDLLLAGTNRDSGQPRGWLARSAGTTVRTVTAGQGQTVASTPGGDSSDGGGTGESTGADDPSLGTSGADGSAARQRGFFSNSGDEPSFLTNVFNLTILGFLLSVAGIVYQMVEG